jgi:hypothetical protein
MFAYPRCELTNTQYAQALLSGCVIAADIPTEHEEALRHFVIPLKPTWEIERIHQEINGYLADPERLHQMAMDGFAYARRYLTTTWVAATCAVLIGIGGKSVMSWLWLMGIERV